MNIYNGPIERSGNYAFLNVMQYIGIDITEDDMNLMPDFNNFIKAEHSIKRMIKALKPVIKGKDIDKWLDKGQYVIGYTDEYNPVLSDIYHQYLNGHDKIFFIFIEDLGNMWKILPAFGSQHGDEGYEYLSKRNLNNVKLIRRILP